MISQLILPKQSLPPGYIVKPLYREDIFTLPAAPGLELLIIVCFSTTAARAGCPYFPGGFPVQLFPVVIMPTGSTGHLILPFYSQRYSVDA